MPIHNMKRKDRIVMTRLRTGHCKLTHEYLLKKKKNRIPNVYPMQPNFINPSSSNLNAASTLIGKNTK